MNIRIKLPLNVKYIIEKLNEEGYEAYVVGGCVRDSILGVTPADFDITTNALPENVCNVFGNNRTKPTGIKYGTVTVLVEDERFEVTTYRIDLKYSDGRRPDRVLFAQAIEKELSRRDFTINAMAYNEESGIIYLFDGKADIENKIIRCVGNPDIRFSEDGLRMMRAARFAAQTGFEIEYKTLESMHKNRALIKNISCERIIIELNKMLISKNPYSIKILFSTGLMEYIIPMLYEVFLFKPEIIYEALKLEEKLESKVYLRISVLLYTLRFKMGIKPEDYSADILKKLKYDNTTIGKVIKILRYIDYKVECNKKDIRKTISIMGQDTFMDILNIKKSMNCNINKDQYLLIENMAHEIIKSNECFSLKQLAVDGLDIKSLGYSGEKIGYILQKLLSIVVDEPNLNFKEELIKIAKNYLK